jgi:3-oxoacyl-[acyl-carrier-protein] synthase II
MAAFLVLETAEHAIGRGASPYCRVCDVRARHTRRENGDVESTLIQIWDEIEPAQKLGSTGILSGASGVSPWTEEEAAALSSLSRRWGGASIRNAGSFSGHGMEASFIFNAGLAALALRHGFLYPPLPGDSIGESQPAAVDRVLVTSVGHFRGEAATLLARPGWGRSDPEGRAEATCH